ncbi:MAG: kelch repeat-containing protein [Henriciella sp.]|uniref:Kelch repeat-containing protein n=1 Tax=Henriciella sp. TaxID=1968823 RepID=UPI0032EA9959
MTQLSRRRTLQLISGSLAASALSRPAFARDRAASGWRDGTSLPFPVQEIYPCLHDGRIHVAGGFISENGAITGPTTAHHALDPASGLWDIRAGLPVARHHPQLVSFMGRLLSIGGFEARENGAWQMQGDMWLYNESDDSWAWAPDLPAPNAESVAGVIRNRLHVVGGRQPAGDRNLDWTDHTDTGAHWVFDGERWRDGAPMPTPRNSAAGIVVDERLHVVGGRTVADGNTAVHECYDPWSDRWERLAPMPIAQAGLAAGVVGHKLYVFGGEYFENGGGVFPEAWEYDSIRDRWRALPDMPEPRHGLGGVTVGKDIYLIGGARKRGGNQTSAAVEIYQP